MNKRQHLRRCWSLKRRMMGHQLLRKTNRTLMIWGSLMIRMMRSWASNQQMIIMECKKMNKKWRGHRRLWVTLLGVKICSLRDWKVSRTIWKRTVNSKVCQRRSRRRIGRKATLIALRSRRRLTLINNIRKTARRSRNKTVILMISSCLRRMALRIRLRRACRGVVRLLIWRK